jgi:hypothetical protein
VLIFLAIRGRKVELADLKNSSLQAEELDKSYKRLRDEFDRISKIPQK